MHDGKRGGSSGPVGWEDMARDWVQGTGRIAIGAWEHGVVDTWPGLFLLSRRYAPCRVQVQVPGRVDLPLRRLASPCLA